MDLLAMILITLQISTALTKKKYSRRSNRDSAESPEYYSKLMYKDCKHNTTPAAQEPVKLRQASACPCPKLCCSMCCECTEKDQSPMTQSIPGREMEPLQLQPTSNGFSMPLPTRMDAMQVAPQPQRHHVQPQIIQRGGKKKKKMNKPDSMMQPPIGSRRDFGFTREKIKNLISQDQDIKKILKDLVRVTMHKVDLVEKVKTKMNLNVPTPTPSEDDEYME